MKNHHQAHVYMPQDLWEKLSKLATDNRRSVSAEIVMAVEKRLERLDAVKKYSRKRRNSK